MKTLIAIIILLTPLLAVAEEARGRFVVSMTIAESCVLTDQGIHKCTSGMRKPMVVQEKVAINTPEGSSERIVTVVTY
ncbi:TPA: hypothetical protein ACG4NT_000040 [Stenotrophomonas maltophilia]|uniref:hypothetical protein n=1 Tax=unclassified Stenotrophomonas TaxID=196198 RepID=UPI00244950BA|nr:MULTISPECIES: hypothetical protein [unclassified Stenotrophomonas]HDS1363581.1 hypothetical protein [Stenotrophomonas maltophilia]MDH0190159.1 hypothetical protein [Stenotrophomonas sp. GD04051]MDH0463935.1 hypothetical protein [Stenotrophomonas sp. GD03993]MDH0874557.1 hypothetical protein [Stenotrophomonas sp. GD03877]MDH2155158.1 hypothetical protein [Stenotrophomonas sp. GD03657]